MKPTTCTITEKQLQECVRKLCKLLGCAYFHVHNSKRSPPGFPDCVIITTDRRVIFAELKTERGKLSIAQQAWLEWLREGGQRAYVWRPSDWKDGTIERAVRPQVEVRRGAGTTGQA